MSCVCARSTATDQPTDGNQPTSTDQPTTPQCETLQPEPRPAKEAGTAAAGDEDEDEEEEEATGGFRIRLEFSENPYFTNKVLCLFWGVFGVAGMTDEGPGVKGAGVHLEFA